MAGHFVFSFLGVLIVWAGCFPRSFGEALAKDHKKFMEGWGRVYQKQRQDTNATR